jgi:hypothetical protein
MFNKLASEAYLLNICQAKTRHQCDQIIKLAFMNFVTL